MKFRVHQDISKAETLPSIFYKNQDVFDEVKEKIFLKSWQWLGDNSGLKLTNSIQPLTLLDGFLSEPILLTRDSNGDVNYASSTESPYHWCPCILTRYNTPKSTPLVL